MVSGYPLGNKDVEEDIQVIGEPSKDTVTYSKTLNLHLETHSQLVVPYTSIRTAKEARSYGIREVLFFCNKNPEKHPQMRSTLDLWGFSTFLDYIYTVAELGFLEGLIPIIEIQFLSLNDLKTLQEICGIIRLRLTTTSKKNVTAETTLIQEEYLNTLIRTGKLGFPTSINMMIHNNQTKTELKDWFKLIDKLHKLYGHIHDVILHNAPSSTTGKSSPTSEKTMLAAYESARSLLSDNIAINIPAHLNPNIKPFLKAGLRDFGPMPIITSPKTKGFSTPFDFDNFIAQIVDEGLMPQQRFPIRYDFIKDGKYSKKLGQVFDAYKYKIKKFEQEKIKEIKASL